MLKGWFANIECKIMNTFPISYHTTSVSEVEVVTETGGNPLAHFRRSYVRVQ